MGLLVEGQFKKRGIVAYFQNLSQDKTTQNPFN